MTGLATISGYHGLIAALRARKDALGMSDKDLDEICNWPDGTVSKYLARGAKKMLGSISMGKILRGLGLDLIAIENPERTAQLRAVLEPREQAQVRHNDVVSAAKHPIVIVEFSRQHMKKLGKLGGNARNRKLSRRRRRAIARKGANARWELAAASHP